MSETNPWEAQARARKVEALSRYLIKTMLRMPSVTSDDLARDAAVRFCERSDDAAWDLLAEAAGVNPPSEATRAAVLRFLTVERDSYRTLDGDPFAGLEQAG